MTETEFEVHYEDGEVIVTDYRESLELFEDQRNSGRRCYVKPVPRPYNEP